MIKTISVGENNGLAIAYTEKSNEILVGVKEEPFMFLDGGGGPWQEEEQLPKAMERLRENAPPPFLKKTFEIVDDVDTDSIISWSSTKDSFVVWDPHKFSADLLPKHFKHNNFSSFIRQLNTYRFRKINPDRWEFASEGFEQGKKHLLKHIKRRRNISQFVQQRGAKESWFGSTTEHGISVEAEIEKMKNDYGTFKEEISKLKQQHESSMHYLAGVRERLHAAETKQKHTVVFMIKSLKNPVFLQHCVDRMKKKRKAVGGRVLKKRRLASEDVGICSVMDSIKAIDVDVDVEEIGLDEEENHEVYQELMIESEIQPLSSDGSGSSENFVLWEKLMEDDMIYEEAASKEHSDIVSELEDLIANPANGTVVLAGSSAST